MIKNLLSHSLRKLYENLCFWAQHKNCLHVRGELYLSTGFMDKYTPDIPECGNRCCICTGKWAEFFLPVKREMVVSFLQSDEVVKAMHLIAKNDNSTDVLWSASASMKDAIFCKKGYNRFNCDCLMLQLISLKLIKLEKRDEGLTWFIT